MKIDNRLSKYSIRLSEILSDENLSEIDKMNILFQHALKRYILYDNNKEFLMEMISHMYDTLEENANSLGYLN